MAIYLKYGSLKGSVTEDGHKDWIELDSFQMGIGRGVSTPVGSASSRETSAPSVSEATVTKRNDNASLSLWQESLEGGDGVKAEIHFTRTESGKMETYAKYELTNTLISGFSQSSGGDGISESISLNFTKMLFSFTPGGVDGKPGTAASATYDLATAKIV